MSEQNLCWKCREMMGYPLDALLKNPHLHCHHEPKKKEKCWCELNLNYYLSYPTGTNLIAETYQIFKPKFCPECGRKL